MEVQVTAIDKDWKWAWTLTGKIPLDLRLHTCSRYVEFLLTSISWFFWAFCPHGKKHFVRDLVAVFCQMGPELPWLCVVRMQPSELFSSKDCVFITKPWGGSPTSSLSNHLCAKSARGLLELQHMLPWFLLCILLYLWKWPSLSIFIFLKLLFI